MTTPDENTPSDAVAAPSESVAAPAEATPQAPVAPPSYADAPAPAPYAPPQPPQGYAPPAANPMPNTWMNITAFVTGLLGLGIVPIIFGHLGVNRSNKGTADFKWMGIVGLVLGYLTIVIYLIITAAVIGLFAANGDRGY